MKSFAAVPKFSKEIESRNEDTLIFVCCLSGLMNRTIYNGAILAQPGLAGQDGGVLTSTAYNAFVSMQIGSSQYEARPTNHCICPGP